jgi:hypothetical protein
MEVIISQPDSTSIIESNITNEDFSRLVHNVADAKGLIIDELW